MLLILMLLFNLQYDFLRGGNSKFVKTREKAGDRPTVIRRVTVVREKLEFLFGIPSFLLLGEQQLLDKKLEFLVGIPRFLHHIVPTMRFRFQCTIELEKYYRLHCIIEQFNCFNCFICFIVYPIFYCLFEDTETTLLFCLFQF